MGYKLLGPRYALIEGVIFAIKHNYYALQYASERLKNDQQFMLTAVQQDYDTLIYAPDALKNNSDFMRLLRTERK